MCNYEFRRAFLNEHQIILPLFQVVPMQAIETFPLIWWYYRSFPCIDVDLF